MEPEILLCFLPGALPKPSLRAEPGPLLPRGRPVTFLCSSVVWAQSFLLEKDGRPVHPDQISGPQDGSQRTQATFNIPAVSEDTAGNYTCVYRHVYGWSERSEPLELQVTEEDATPPSGPASRDYTVENSIRLGLAGVVLLILVAILMEAGLSQRSNNMEVSEEFYSFLFAGPLPKPSFFAMPGPVIPWGRPVTLVCQGPAGVHSFYLEKDGRPVYPYEKRASPGGMKGTEARFLFPVASEVTAGSYRCLYEQAPNSWSERSEPLELKVREEDFTSSSGPASRDYTVENSIRMGLAGVVLLILVAILVEAGLSQRRAPQGPQEYTQGSPPERGTPWPQMGAA
ncbi:leukocyte immunoglobulin-like receptor subfamily A member 4 [Myotis daubentonii]|uniref:leukocyte immunoglobulin-like receptor subfamily A member 4 n=1 Tax=Myotis daubentonii TaxID=98922 RepID=UPI0028730E47|nr:leukocyte immunoglobulin-like receptor subfamily A member 4 [Myotis daubentonii]